MSDIKVAAVTLMGQKHRQRGVPCEDSSLALERNGVHVVAIADGAGSKQYTHARYGSECAVNAIADLLCDNFDVIYNENREAAVRSLIIAAVHIKFADLLVEHKLDSIERLSCTLLFCAVKDRRMIIGHIGDGLIAKVSSSGISPLTMPQNDNAGKTYFVTAAHAGDYLRLIKTTTDDVHAVTLMTDGVQDSVYDENSGLVKPVVARMAETLQNGREESEKEITSIVEKYIVGASNNSDDSSFGVMLFSDTKAPDTSVFPSSAEAFPRTDKSFKDLQAELAPLVKKARNIMIQAKAVASPAETEDSKSRTNETDEAAEVTASKMENISESAKRQSFLMYILVAVETVAIILLLLKIIFF